MPQMVTTTDINRSPEIVFDLLADFAAYGSWLDTSETFNTLRDIIDNPVKAGTTYTDAGQQVTLHGEVTVCHPPHRLTFHQIGSVSWVIPLGTLEITIAYLLTPTNTGTHLERVQTVVLSGPLRLLQSRLLRIMKQENQRILNTVREHLEA